MRTSVCVGFFDFNFFGECLEVAADHAGVVLRALLVEVGVVRRLDDVTVKKTHRVRLVVPDLDRRNLEAKPTRLQ